MPAQASMREPIPGIAEDVKEVAKVEVEPVNFSGFMQRAQSRFGEMDYAGAQSDYEQAVAKRPENFRSRVQLARTYLAQGNTEGAREHVEVAIDIDGASSLAWNTLGRVELAEHDNQAAIVSFERAAEENEDNSYAWNNLGFAQMEEGNFEDAVTALEAATSGGSPTGYMWNNLGMAYEHLDRISLARASYRQAADLGSGRAQDNFDRLEGVVSLVVTPAGDANEVVDALVDVPAGVMESSDEF
jgi:Flp pilus assembly protein TadD